MRFVPRRAVLAGALLLLPGTTVALPVTAAHAAPDDSGSAAKRPAAGQGAPAAGPSGAPRVSDPDTVLPKGWRTSGDRAVTIAGDGSGLHVLVADSKDAYQWHTVATLSESGFPTDLWIGNSCVTGSGERAVVVYAPRQFTNQQELMERGAFAAVVDLGSGAVTKLPDQVSLAYFDPGCGADENAVLTQAGGSDLGRTRLLRVDAATGKTVSTTTVDGELTSAVPTGDTIVGASGNRLTRVDRAGGASVLATTGGPAFSIHPDAGGGVAFLDQDGGSVRARRMAGGTVATLAHGAPGTVGLQAGTGGNVFLTGSPEGVGALPHGVRALAVTADATVSSQGAIAVDQAVSARVRSLAADPLQAPKGDERAPVEIQAEVPATGRKLTFSLPAATDGDDGTSPGSGAASPALAVPAAATQVADAAPAGAAVARAGAAPAAASTLAAGSPTDTVDGDGTCGIPRNDPTQQAYQPTPNQVEWAVDMAVRGDLTTNWLRQGGWRTQDGLGTVNPQGMFPLPSLVGAPTGHIPPQLLLGVLAQESNLWQAEGGALPGQTGNPLTGNFYGHPKADAAHPQDVWQINWASVDCGYGIGQQTDGMHSPDQLRPGDQARPVAEQKAIALDYASGIAVAAQTLANKWNELHDPATPTIKINNDDPAAIENWFGAAWAYNGGLNAYNPADPSASWGLGYYSNPANPLYPPTRTAFLDANHYADAAHPQSWPYQEKVLGWAAWPIDTGRSYDDNGVLNSGNTAGYSAAWWTSSGDRTRLKPALDVFCNAQNTCDATQPPRCEVDHLGAACDTPFWWHGQAVWKNCALECGHEYLTYKTLRVEPGNGSTGAPDCTAPGSGGTAPPAGSLVIDSVSGAVAPMRAGCTRTWTNAGTLGFEFSPDAAGHYEAKADLHQIGGGYGAHFWYAHTRSDATSVSASTGNLDYPPAAYGTMAITGTWRLSRQLDGWTRVFVHLPDSGSQTQQAIYTIHLGDGTSTNRILNVASNANHWVSLGVFRFTTGTYQQGVSLSNFTPDGDAVEDVAWDATAFQPLPAKPRDVVVQMGDSYSSGEGAQPYYYGSDMGPYASIGTQDSPGRSWNACRRSLNSYARQTVIPGRPGTIGSMADSYDNALDFHNTSCSGAYTYTVDSQGAQDAAGHKWGFLGEHHEVPQLASGFLNEDTTLVMLTVGGNDADFGGTVSSCAQPQVGCPADTEVRADIDGIVTPLKSLLEHIHAKAANARIILLGYPDLFDRSNSSVTCTVMGNLSQENINSWAGYMRDRQAAAVTAAQASGTPVTFYPANTEFAGYRVCDGTPGINDLVSAPTPKDSGDFSCPDNPICPSMESYHPNNAGTKRYALALQTALTAAPY